MTSLTPIPTTRVSNLLIQNRLLSQLQNDQLDMFRIQEQIATGRRIGLPSEDAPAALRGLKLQRLIERKLQVQTNLRTNQSFLSATDSTLNDVAGLLGDVRGLALSVAGTDVTQEQRLAVAQQIGGAISQMIDIGNQQFRGRYLFAGSRTGVRPYEPAGNFIEYVGNETRLESYSDVDVLFDTNAPGQEVLGAISEPVRSVIDLNPHLTRDTLLSSLRGGQGIRPGGSITVSDGTNTSIVDLSAAATIGDVARLIEENPPAGRSVAVDFTNYGFRLSLDAAGGGNLTVTEVGSGKTAAELGIFNDTGVLTGPLASDDLDPVVLPTTPLDNILGTKSSAKLTMAGANNDLLINAADNGAQFNLTAVHIVNSAWTQSGPPVGQGLETAEYDTNARPAQAGLRLSGVGNDLILTANTPGVSFNDVQIELYNAGDVETAPIVTFTTVGGQKKLLLGIDDSNETPAGNLRGAINAEGTFQADPDPSAGDPWIPSNPVLTSDIGFVFGQTGKSGGEAGTLYVNVNPNLTTSEDAANAINAEGTFAAQIDPRDALSPEQAGEGIVDLNATATTDGGSGIVLDRSGLVVENRGETFTIDLTDAVTVEDMLNAINGSGAGLHAEINADGTGVNVRSRISGSGFGIGENGGTTAEELGIRTFTAATELADLNRTVGVPTIPGVDFQIVSNDGATVLDIDVSSAATIQDVIDEINNHPSNGGTVLARVAEFGNGIELVDDDPTAGNTLFVRRVNSSLAPVFLGFMDETELQSTTTTAAGAPFGIADLTNPNTDLNFTAVQAGTALGGALIRIVDSGAVSGDNANVSYNPGGNALTIDIDSTATTALTIRDEVNLEGTFVAALDTTNGGNNGSGVVIDTGDIVTLSAGTPDILTAEDVNPHDNASVFDTLIRLKDALESGEVEKIEQLLPLIDDDILRSTFARSEVGARQQGLTLLETRLAAEEVQLRETLSIEIDTDLTDAISELNGRQLAFEASLQTAASLLQLSILDFI